MHSSRFWFALTTMILSAFFLCGCHDPTDTVSKAELWQTDTHGQVLKISGMHCEACAKKIENKLLEQDGVSMAKIDFQTGLLKVSFDDSKISLTAIKNIIVSMGFQVTE